MALSFVIFAGPASLQARTLRVCADPNNLPFSDSSGHGFENEIVDLVSKDIGAQVEWVWYAQQRGFIRHTLGAGSCDLVPGVPSAVPGIATTHPYYRSIYAFVAKPALADIVSFGDPRLAGLKIGVQLVGDSGFNAPPVQALVKRGLTKQMRGFPVYARGRPEAASSPLIDAVSRGEVDIAIAAGPTAGYFAARATPPLSVRPVSPIYDGPRNPMVFDISMAVQMDDVPLQNELNAALARRRKDIEAILQAYHVPTP